MPITVNANRNHQPDRSVSCNRRTATAIPGINRTRALRVYSGFDSPPNRTSSQIVATADATIENKVHHQYSDLLDLVLKSRYLRKPEAIDCAKVIYRIFPLIPISISEVNLIVLDT